MKKILFLYLSVTVTLAILLFGCISLFDFGLTNIYKDNLRGTLFTAFLTMGSFMLSLMSMFMFSLKEKLFDDGEYKKLYSAKEKITNESDPIYGPLVNISRLFLFCVMMCFITSILQFTIGLIDNICLTVFCLSLAISTIFLALYILYNVWRNLEVWFHILLKKKIE